MNRSSSSEGRHKGGGNRSPAGCTPTRRLRWGEGRVRLESMSRLDARRGRKAAVLAAALTLLPGAAASLGGGGASAPSQSADACPRPAPVDGTGDHPFRWRAVDGLEGVARALAGRGELLRPMPGLGDPVPWILEAARRPPTVYVLEDLGCLEALGLAGARPDWVAGVASFDGNWIALRAGPAEGGLRDVPTVYRHEVAHLALHAAAGGSVPRWLHEGYAQYAAGAWDWRQAWRLRFILFGSGNDLLDRLSLGFPGSESGARAAYLLSYTAVHELASISGTSGLASLFGAFRQGLDADLAMRRVYGLTLDQFEERWRKGVTQRYGILYILSRAAVFWTAVTLLLLWFGWRRKQRDRRKLQRMKEEEWWHEAWERRRGASGGAPGEPVTPPRPPPA